MKLALKIDVDTYRGTREGVPRLLDMLKKHNAQATFLFSLGPDHTGRAIKRVLRPGFMKRCRALQCLNTTASKPCFMERCFLHRISDAPAHN